MAPPLNKRPLPIVVRERWEGAGLFAAQPGVTRRGHTKPSQAKSCAKRNHAKPLHTGPHLAAPHGALSSQMGLFGTPAQGAKWGQIGRFRDLPKWGFSAPPGSGHFQDHAKSGLPPVYDLGVARKPTPPQLLALSGLHDQLALAGKPINPRSPFWGPLRRRNWLSDDGRVSPEGKAVLDRYRTVALACHHCETNLASYVAERGVTKVLRRRCSVCGSERQRFVVDGSNYEVVGE